MPRPEARTASAMISPPNTSQSVLVVKPENTTSLGTTAVIAARNRKARATRYSGTAAVAQSPIANTASATTLSVVACAGSAAGHRNSVAAHARTIMASAWETRCILNRSGSPWNARAAGATAYGPASRAIRQATAACPGAATVPRVARL